MSQPAETRNIMSDRLAVLLLFLLGTGIYLNALGNGFVGDDHAIVVDYPLIRDIRNIPAFFASQDLVLPGEATGYYRPLARMSYLIDYQLWGLNPFGYHLHNILLHGATTIAFFLTAKLLFSRNSALYAASLFAIHPIHVEAVAWISGRNNLLAALFIMLSFYFYIRFERDGRRAFVLLSLLCFAIALFCKEFALMLPLLLVLYHTCCVRGAVSPAKIVARLLPFVFLAGLYLLARRLVVGPGGAINFAQLPHNLLVSLKSFFTYFHVLLFPATLKITYFIPSQEPFLNVRGVVALFVMILVAVTALRLYTRARGLFFAIAFAFLFLLPVSGIITFTQVPVAERYAYMASMGFCLFVGLVAERSLDYRAPLVTTLLATALVVYGYKTVARNGEWHDDLTLSLSTVREMPRSPIAHYYLGNAYRKNGKVSEAIAEFRTSVSLNPGFPHSRLALASLFQEMGMLDDATREYREILSLMPDNVEVRSSLAFIFFQQGMIEEAIRELQAVLEVNPGDAASRANLAALEKEREMLKKADVRDLSERASFGR